MKDAALQWSIVVEGREPYWQKMAIVDCPEITPEHPLWLKALELMQQDLNERLKLLAEKADA